MKNAEDAQDDDDADFFRKTEQQLNDSFQHQTAVL